MSQLDTALRGLPGIDLPGATATGRPDVLRLAGADLFAGVTRPGDALSIERHRQVWGTQPTLTLTGLAAAAAAADLRGAGGAGFPTSRKLESIRGERVSTVVVNGSEGELTSAKDGVLLSHVPHLVLDGAAAVATAAGCRTVVIQVSADRPAVLAAVSRAIAEREDPRIGWDVRVGDDSFVSGEASAVIQALAGSAPLPRDIGKPPRDPRSRIRRTHVFLSNVETFARLALAARGHQMSTALVTASGAVTHPGVYEVPRSWTLLDLARACGQIGTPDIVITGGWHGSWLPWRDAAYVALDRDHIARAGGRWGAGAIVWLPEQIPPQRVLAGITRYLAAESAGQCGPCVAGLPALADAVARGGLITHEFSDVEGRGLCAHPTATAAAVRSALAAIRNLGADS